ncbi:MAG: MBL fold metallo-hydrolase [Parcubacteria group bacterium]|nr:MBL fold metallo-hydrolase [Parcubacteria group bacterium]
MVITRLNEIGFKIESRGLIILINPGKSKTKPDIVLYSEIQKETGYTDSFVIGNPGEYEVKGVFIQGLSLNNESSSFLMNVEEINVFYLPRFDKNLSSDTLEEIGQVDILLTDAANVKNIREIEPRLVIPINYKKIDEFLKESGLSKKEPQDKLAIKKKDLAEKGTEAVILKN